MYLREATFQTIACCFSAGGKSGQQRAAQQLTAAVFSEIQKVPQKITALSNAMGKGENTA